MTSREAIPNTWPELRVSAPLTDDERESVRRVVQTLPSFIDGRWRAVDALPGQIAYIDRVNRLSVILSVGRQDDGRWWLHFSVAHRNRVPTWAEFVRSKEDFLGPETKAVQVLAPRSQWVNIHPYALHLWVCLDGDPLPDFTMGLRSI